MIALAVGVILAVLLLGGLTIVAVVRAGQVDRMIERHRTGQTAEGACAPQAQTVRRRGRATVAPGGHLTGHS